jgi:hydrogenase 3 maturation protease
MKMKPKKVLLGVGNSLRSDDAAGSFIAQNFKNHSWVVLDGKTAPENVTSVIKEIQPQLLLIIDATHMNLEVGSFRIIPLEKIISMHISTHSMPLFFLMEYLKPYCQKIIFVGIQPLSTKIGENISKPVLDSCLLLIELLKNNRIEEIKILS